MTVSNAMLDHYRTQSLGDASLGIETSHRLNAETLHAGLKILFPWMQDADLLFREQFGTGILWIVPATNASEETKEQLQGLREELQTLMEDYLQPDMSTHYTGQHTQHITIAKMENLAKAINVRASYLDQCHERAATDPASLQYQLSHMRAPQKQAEQTEEAIVVKLKPTPRVTKAEIEPLRREGFNLSRILKPQKQETFATTNSNGEPAMGTRNIPDYRKAALNCKALLQAIGKHDANTPTISATRIELVFDPSQTIYERNMPLFNGIEKTSVSLPLKLKESFEKLLDKKLRVECSIPMNDEDSVNRMQQILEDYMKTSPNQVTILKDAMGISASR